MPNDPCPYGHGTSAIAAADGLKAAGEQANSVVRGSTLGWHSGASLVEFPELTISQPGRLASLASRARLPHPPASPTGQIGQTSQADQLACSLARPAQLSLARLGPAQLG